MQTPLIDRARAYVAKMPAAVSGQNGHGATFQVARTLLHFFQLSREDAATVLAEYNGRCSPAWTAKELNHKLESAAKSKWEGPRASDSDRKTGRPSSPQAGKPRTLRTGFCKSVSVAASSGPEISHLRTLRTAFSDKSLIRAHAGAHTHVCATAKNLSEVSEPVRPPDPPPAEQKKEAPAQTARPLHGVEPPAAPTSAGLPDPAVINWRAAKLEPGGDFRTRFTRFVDDRGRVHHAQVVEADGVRTIRIGRQICQIGGENA